MLNFFLCVQQVGDTDDWTLGVAAQWVCRKVEFEPCPDAGLWCIGLRNGECRALTAPSEILQLTSSDHLHTVRLRLDCEAGMLTFTNADTNAHLYTFTCCFSEVLHPYFESVTPGGNLAVLAERVNVSVALDCVPGEDSLIIREEEGIKRELTPVTDSVTSSSASDGKTLNGYSAGDKKSPNCATKEVRTTQTRQKNQKVSNNKTAAKKQSGKKRFNVTYQVSLNRALNDINGQHGNQKNLEM